MARPRNKTTLGRAAVGLPRYYLDTGWWRAVGFAGLDATALFVWQAAVSYCTETSTDGRMPADLEDLSVSLGVRLSDLQRAVPQLITKGRWVEDGDHLVMPDWSDHNPTKEEVEAYTAERSELGRRGNHERHHVKKGVVNPNCEFCTPVTDPARDPASDRYSDPGSDPVGDPRSDPVSLGRGSHGMGWDGTSSKSESRDARSSEPNTGPVAEPTGPDEEPHTTADTAATPELTASAAILRTVNHLQATHDKPIRNTDRWRETVNRDLTDRHYTTALQRAHTGWTIDQIANGILDPHYRPTTNTITPPPQLTDAEKAEAKQARARARAQLRRHQPPAAEADPCDPAPPAAPDATPEGDPHA